MKKPLLFLSFALLCSYAQMQASSTTVINGGTYDVDTLQHFKVGPGTFYTAIKFEGEDLTFRTFYLTIDAQQPNVDFRTELGRDSIIGVENISDHATRKTGNGEYYYAAINGDFFETSGDVGAPVNGSIENGLLATVAPTSNPHFMWDSSLQPYASYVQSSYTIRINGGEAVALSRVNERIGNDEIIVFNSTNGKYTHTPAGTTEVALELLPGQSWGINKTITAKVVGAATTTGNKAIAAGQAVLSATGSKASLVSGLSEGDEVEIMFDMRLDQFAGQTPDLTQMVGGNTIFLAQGATTPQGDTSRHPRSMLGYNQDRSKLIFCVVDGRSALSSGAMYVELADIMKYAGAYDAINIDGGGSSSIFLPMFGAMNNPSDGHERACGNGVYCVLKAPEDDEIAEIRFEDWSLHFPKYGVYTPKVYGYNQYGVLVDTDVAATLSCDASLGEIIDEGRTFYGTGSGTAALKASYNGLEATLPVEILGASDGVAMTFRLANLLIDDVREYPVEINATMHENVMSINPQAFSWSSGDSGIATVGSEDGVVRGVSDGTTAVTGAVGDFTGVLNVTVEIPTSSAMPAVSGTTAEEWALLQSGGTGLTLTPEGEGFVLSYTGNGSGRGAYIQLTRATRLWSLPDKIRMRIDANGAPVSKVQMSVTNALGETLSNWALTGEIAESGETTLEGSISEWCDAEDIGVYPITINNIRFSMGASTKGQQFEIRVLGIDGIYDDFDAVSSIEARGGVRVWPNPVAGGETVRVEADGEAVVTVYGMNGALVSETAIEGVGEVSTAGLAQGVYVVKVATASGIHTAKLIVK